MQECTGAVFVISCAAQVPTAIDRARGICASWSRELPADLHRHEAPAEPGVHALLHDVAAAIVVGVAVPVVVVRPESATKPGDEEPPVVESMAEAGAEARMDAGPTVAGPTAASPTAARNSRYACSADRGCAREAIAKRPAADCGRAKAGTSGTDAAETAAKTATAAAEATAKTTAAAVTTAKTTTAAVTTGTAATRQGHVRHKQAERGNSAQGDHRFTQHLSLLTAPALLITTL